MVKPLLVGGASGPGRCKGVEPGAGQKHDSEHGKAREPPRRRQVAGRQWRQERQTGSRHTASIQVPAAIADRDRM